MVVNTAKKMPVKRPPLICRAKKAGTNARRVPRRMLLKLSLPAESAGRGAFLIEGYYQVNISLEIEHRPVGAAASQLELAE